MPNLRVFTPGNSLSSDFSCDSEGALIWTCLDNAAACERALVVSYDYECFSKRFSCSDKFCHHFPRKDARVGALNRKNSIFGDERTEFVPDKVNRAETFSYFHFM